MAGERERSSGRSGTAEPRTSARGVGGAAHGDLAGSSGAVRPGRLPVDLVIAWVAFVALVAATVLLQVMVGSGAEGADAEGFAWFAPAGWMRLILIPLYAGVAAWLAFATRRAMSVARRAPVSVLTMGGVAVLGVLDLAALILDRFALEPAVLVLTLACWAASGFAFVRERATGARSRFMPFALYLGWNTVRIACAVGALITVAPADEPGVAAPLATIAIMIVLAILAFLMRRLCDDCIFGAAVAWCFVAEVAHLAGASMFWTVAAAIAGAAGIFFALAPWERFRRPVSSDRAGSTSRPSARPQAGPRTDRTSSRS